MQCFIFCLQKENLAYFAIFYFLFAERKTPCLFCNVLFSACRKKNTLPILQCFIFCLQKEKDLASFAMFYFLFAERKTPYLFCNVLFSVCRKKKTLPILRIKNGHNSTGFETNISVPLQFSLEYLIYKHMCLIYTYIYIYKVNMYI